MFNALLFLIRGLSFFQVGFGDVMTPWWVVFFLYLIKLQQFRQIQEYCGSFFKIDVQHAV